MPMEKTFNAAEAEPRLYARWEDEGCFKAGANASRDETFCIMIPPPNVTGSLHMGHAFNNTLQDILIRWKRMQGYDTLWQPGTDHAGIATQMVTEREMAANQEPSRAEMGRAKFLARVWEQKVKSRGTIIGQLKRLGASCDWSREAFTMGGAEGDPDKGKGPNFHDAVIKVFVDMYNKGLIYRGKRLVNWDPHFETAISDLEVENIEVAGHMWHFKYPLAGGQTYEYVEKDADGNVTLRETRDYISIATTRPETMLGDGAVAVHPDDTRYAPIVGKLCEIPVGPKEHRRLIPIITDEYPDPEFGSGAVKITGAHDFNDYQVAKRGGIPMYRLMDTKAQMRDDGVPYAEAAAIAMEVAEGKRELSEAECDAINLVPDELRGMDRFDARKAVVAQITDEGLAVMTPNPKAEEDGAPAELPLVENKPIMQPFGDRSKVVIEPMLTDQWFVDAEQIVGPALDKVRDGTVKIMPESGEKTYYHWLDNIEPWCISRQLWWGHQIPVWTAMVPTVDGDLIARNDVIGRGVPQDALHDYHAKKQLDEERLGGKLSKNGWLVMEFCAASAEEAKKQIEDIWIERIGRPPEELVELNEEPAQFGPSGDSDYDFSALTEGPFRKTAMWRDPDVLDTWFSSGLWPIGTLGWPEESDELKKYFPTSTLVTGQDILFFWVARMMMMQLAVTGEVPFDEVYLHGLVRDAKGKKMSKSVGNVIDPLEIIDEYGADALRFSSAAMASLGGVLKLDLQRVQGYRNFTTKLWNATRYAEMNEVFTARADVPDTCPTDVRQLPDAAQTLNRWIIGETAKVREEVDAAMAEYKFNDAANALYAFVWGKVCDWYVEFSKPLLLDGADAVKAETRDTMAWVLEQCFILLHPIMPFITEELWGTTGDHAKMLVHADWPTYGAADLVDRDADREMNWTISLIESIRSVRAQMRVPAGLYVPVVQVALDEAGRKAYANNETLIKRLARIGEVTEAAEAPKGALTIAVDGGTFALPLADIIDVGAEKERLGKTLTKLQKELGGLKGRLNNPKFVASAPAEVVEESRERLVTGEAELATLSAALERLEEAS